MFKQTALYLLLSTLIIVFSNIARTFIVYIDMLYTHATLLLAPLFNPIGLGFIVLKVLVLVLIPIAITSVPALAYRGIQGRQMPHFIAITWVLWLIIVLSDVLIR